MAVARNSFNSALGGDFVRTKIKSSPSGSITFGRIYHVKNEYVEYFYGNAYYDGAKIQALYNFKKREAFGTGSRKIPQNQWKFIRNELLQYFQNLELEYKSLHK